MLRKLTDAILTQSNRRPYCKIAARLGRLRAIDKTRKMLHVEISKGTSEHHGTFRNISQEVRRKEYSFQQKVYKSGTFSVEMVYRS